MCSPREGERGNGEREKGKRKRDNEIEIGRGTLQAKAYRANTYTVMTWGSKPQEGESSARVARTQILVCVYIYIYMEDFF